MYFSRLLTFKDRGLEMHENRVHQKCLVKCSKPAKTTQVYPRSAQIDSKSSVHQSSHIVCDRNCFKKSLKCFYKST